MRCLQDILGLTLWDRSRNADVLEECGEATVRDQLRMKRLQWFGHLMRMPTHQPQRQILKSRPQEKRRPPGGTPCDGLMSFIKTWQAFPIGIVLAMEYAIQYNTMVNNRTKWRACIHQPLDHHGTSSST